MISIWPRGGFNIVGVQSPVMTLQPEPLEEAVDALQDGALTPTAYVHQLCGRIDKVEPVIHALVPEPDRRGRLLRSVPDGASDERSADRPPLAGVPIGVKDVIHVEGFETAAGTAVPPDLFAGMEASVVRRLRDAGAAILGKTATTEFAGHAPAPTRNPHNPAHTPGGSSSGSAAAVAAGLCPLALGTQTGGSVIRPAAFCGVVGFVPSTDRIPTDGVVPRSPSIDAVGLFTQDIAGMTTASAVACLDWTPVESVDCPTLGIPDDVLERATPAAVAVFREQVDTLRNAGFAVRRADAFEDLAAVDDWHRALTRWEVAQVHEWFDDHRAHYRQTTAAAIIHGRDVTECEYEDAQASRTAVQATVHARMDDADVDLWITPAAPGTAPRGLAETGSSDMNRPWTFAGLPALTVPTGRIGGLPVGLQLVSERSEDEQLLAWADAIAKALDV